MEEQNIFVAIGQKVRAFRKQAGLTQKEVAEKALVHQSDLATFEKRGEKIKGLDIISRIVEATGHQMQDLFADASEKKTFTPPRVMFPSSRKVRPTMPPKTALPV